MSASGLYRDSSPEGNSPAVPFRPFRLTPMHHRHVALGAKMAEEAGWRRPEAYRDLKEELWALREAVGLIDISPLGKLELKGKGLPLFLQGFVPAMGASPVGGVERARVRDGVDGSLCEVYWGRFSDDHLLMTTAPGEVEGVGETLLQWIARTGGCLHLTNMTSAFAGVAILGPSSRALLRKLTSLDLSPSAFPAMTCAQGRVGKIPGILLRVDPGGQLGYKLYFAWEYGEYMWDVIVDLGGEFGAAPVGLLALRRLSGEAAGSAAPFVGPRPSG